MTTTYQTLKGNGDQGLIKAWVKDVLFEEQVQKQLKNIAALPFIYRWVAAMPDVHLGKGATVGSVIPTKGAIIPAAVGVDIGCGMMAVQTSLKAEDLPSDLKLMRDNIEKAVPHGRSDNGGKNDRGAWGDAPEEVQIAWMGLEDTYNKIVHKHRKIEHHMKGLHLGTLGTGNHFIEVCLDEKSNVWIMLHSGSRGVGNKIGQYFIELAMRDMERFFIHLPDKELGYFPEGTDHFDDYVEAVHWAQEYAKVNRELMMQSTIAAMLGTRKIPRFTADLTVVNCHHNYVAIENHYGDNVYVTRKGAVRARKNDLGIIPGSMGTKSYIVRGKGNPESFDSCSHGAGRAMSRTEAKKRFTLADQEEQTKGVECRKDHDVIDEIPKAYKPIDKVMAAQEDLVDIEHVLKQVLCVKG